MRLMAPVTSLHDPLRGPLPNEAGTNGCFETMRAYGGRIFRLDTHVDRLIASATSVGLTLPGRPSTFARRLSHALTRSGIQEAIVRVALWPPHLADAACGSASAAASITQKRQRGLLGSCQVGGWPQPTGPAQPSIVVQPVALPPAVAYRRGIRVATVPARKFSVGSINPQIKYSARLGSVLAVVDAQLRGMDEALFLDATGGVTESTASNMGMVKGGDIFTPPCWLGLLAGVTRDVLFELAHTLRLPIRETPLTRHDVYNADEVFLMSTIKEVLAVTEVDGRRIGTGRPGPTARKLHRAFKQLVKRELGL